MATCHDKKVKVKVPLDMANVSEQQTAHTQAGEASWVKDKRVAGKHAHYQVKALPFNKSKCSGTRKKMSRSRLET